MIDVYLIATVLLILSIGMWELFVAELDVPAWLDVRSLDDLKKSLIDVLVVFVAVKSVEKFGSSDDPGKALRYAIAGSVLILSFTAFRIAKVPKPTKTLSDHPEGRHPAEG